MLKRVYTTAKMTPLVVQPINSNRRVATLDQSEHAGVRFKDEMLYTQVRAISARVNQNYDGFPSQELKKAYKSFIGRPVFVNHHNDDHTKTRGMIVDSQYKESGTDKYIELLLEVDAKQYPKLAEKIAKGELDSVSMGTDVEFTKCSYCDNKAYEVEDFCDHIRTKKGKTLAKIGANGSRENVLVYEACYGLNFFEISYVFDPADETAINQRVYLPKHSSMNKSALGEVTTPEDVDTLRDQESCPVCGDKDFNGKSCSLCEYVAPPEEMQEPDTMKSRVLQIVRNDPPMEEMIRGNQPAGQPPTGKEGRRMANSPTRLQKAVAKQRMLEAQRRLAEDESADMTTDQARESESTDVQEIDQEFTSREEATEPDEKTDVTTLPDNYKSSAKAVAQNRAKYLSRKRAAFGQDDPDQQAGADPQAAAPSDSDGPNSGPPTDSQPGESGIDGLPIDWKQDESGQPYGNVQGTDLDIFVNEDMSWQVLPEGSNDPVAQGQGQSYEDCVQQAFQQAQSLGSDPSAQDPNADPSAPPADPTQAPPAADPNDPTKTSRRKKADGEIPDNADPDKRIDVDKLDTFETVDPDSQYDRSDYDNNSQEQDADPVDGSDKQNFAPGGKPFGSNTKTTSRRVSSIKAMELVDAYIDAGIVANTRTAKYAAVAEIEKISAETAADRLHLLSLVEKAKGTTTAATKSRSLVPRQAQRTAPSFARAASTNNQGTLSASDLDALVTL